MGTIRAVILMCLLGLSLGAGLLLDSINATMGENVIFNTSLNSTETPFISITWKHGTNNIITSHAGGNFTGLEYEGRITLFISTGSLELRNLALTDTGEYSVNIGQGGPQMVGTITLQVHEPVSKVTVSVSNTDLVEFNSSVTLSCSASGSSLSFLWLNDSTEVTASDRVNLTDGGETLTITTVWRYDQGPFKCNVSNLVSSNISDPVKLSINYGPDVPTFTYDKKDMSLNCSADSRPAAQFKWILNGELLSFTGAQLQLKNMETSQSGNYSCQAFNSKTLRYTTSQPAWISVLIGLSEGAIAGIAVTVVLVTGVAAAGGVYLYKQQKARKSNNSSLKERHDN